MEEGKDPSAEYINGFNIGYYMQQYEPSLLDNVLSTNTINPRIDAMRAGKRQYEIEKLKEQTKPTKDRDRQK